MWPFKKKQHQTKEETALNKEKTSFTKEHAMDVEVFVHVEADNKRQRIHHVDQKSREESLIEKEYLKGIETAEILEHRLKIKETKINEALENTYRKAKEEHRNISLAKDDLDDNYERLLKDIENLRTKANKLSNDIPEKVNTKNIKL